MGNVLYSFLPFDQIIIAFRITCADVIGILLLFNYLSFVVGKRNYTSDYNSRSFIWKFDMETSNFSKFQKISTVGAWDWTYFSIANETGPGRFHFLALANTINNNREVVQASQIFYYVENQGPVGSGNFFKVQDIMVGIR